MRPDAPVVILHPPVLPYGYTLHHRFQRVWEVSAYLHGLGMDVDVIDAGLLNMLQNQILTRIPREPFALVTYLEPHMVETVESLLTRIRLINPAVRVFLYGPACHTHPKELSALNPDGMGTVGDAEVQILSFLAELGFSKAQNELASGRITRGLLHPDRWGYPPLERMPLRDIARIYDMKGASTTAAVTVARGCPFHCAFCSTPSIEGIQDRRRPIVGLLEYLAAHPHVERWQFYAPTMTLNRRWCVALFEAMVEARITPPWRCTTRADYLDDDLIERMAHAGCEGFGVGVETLGPAAQLLDKSLDIDLVRGALKAANQYGMRVKCYIMMGLPRQTVGDVQDTIRFVEELGGIPRLTMYSPQGEADSLVRRGAVKPAAPGTTLDRKVYIQEEGASAAFINLLYR